MKPHEKSPGKQENRGCNLVSVVRSESLTHYSIVVVFKGSFLRKDLFSVIYKKSVPGTDPSLPLSNNRPAKVTDNIPLDPMESLQNQYAGETQKMPRKAKKPGQEVTTQVTSHIYSSVSNIISLKTWLPKYLALSMSMYFVNRAIFKNSFLGKNKAFCNTQLLQNNTKNKL